MASSNTGDKLVKPSRKGIGGRPTMMKGDVLKKLEEAFAIGASDQEACFYANISHQTLYNYQEKHPEFVDRKNALKERPVLLARQKVIKAIENNDMQTTRWFLERRKRLEFQTNIDITSDGKAMPSPILNFITSTNPATNDTKRDVVEGEIAQVDETSRTLSIPQNDVQNAGLKQSSETSSEVDSKTGGNIMDDING